MRVGTYKLLEPVGEGGHARVFRAQAESGEILAVKRLLAPPGPLELARFEREAEALARLSHPALPRFVDHGIDEEGRPYLCMELVAGKTARSLMQDGPMLPEEAAAILLPVVEALGVIHAAGLVHRDVKPENIVVTEQGRVALVDFGSVLDSQALRLTAEGAVTGTIPYMAPEQIEGRSVTARVDLRAVLVVFYEMVLGTRPFQRPTSSEEVAAILRGEAPALDTVTRTTSSDAARLISSALGGEDATQTRDAVALGLSLAQSTVLQDSESLSVRVALVRDRTALQTQHAAWGEKLLREAQTQLDRGDSFRALRSLDRALAYGAAKETVDALVSRAKKRAVPGANRRRRGWIAGAAAAMIALAGFIWLKFEPLDSGRPPTVIAPEPPRDDSGFHPFEANSLPNASLEYGTLRQQGSTRGHSRSLREAPPRDPDRRIARARELLEIGRVRDAQRDALAVMKADASNVSAIRLLIEICDRQGELERALPLLRSLVELRPREVDAWTNLSLAESNPTAQRSAVAQALRLSPNDARALRRACSLDVHAHDPDALRMCTNAVRRSPDDAYSLLDLSAARASTGDLRHAIDDATRALALRPDVGVFSEHRARLHDQLGEATDAEADRREACSLGVSTACSPGTAVH